MKSHKGNFNNPILYIPARSEQFKGEKSTKIQALQLHLYPHLMINRELEKPRDGKISFFHLSASQSTRITAINFPKSSTCKE